MVKGDTLRHHCGQQLSGCRKESSSRIQVWGVRDKENKMEAGFGGVSPQAWNGTSWKMWAVGAGYPTLALPHLPGGYKATCGYKGVPQGPGAAF